MRFIIVNSAIQCPNRTLLPPVTRGEASKTGCCMEVCDRQHELQEEKSAVAHVCFYVALRYGLTLSRTAAVYSSSILTCT